MTPLKDLSQETPYFIRSLGIEPSIFMCSALDSAHRLYNEVYSRVARLFRLMDKRTRYIHEPAHGL